jgi:hypothetical protein
MNKKVLGKIETVDVRLIEGYLLGLEMTFKLADGCAIGNGGAHCINIYSGCKWHSSTARQERAEEIIDFITSTLKAAKVDCVARLKNVPVEVEIENDCFRGFRILTEVL